jgi:hypothetical protein
MSICILQLPPDFEERYKKYRAELGDKHTKRTQDVATETKERTTRDFATAKFGLAVKEKLSRVIAEQFTTNEIMNVFTDANIHPDKSLFAKWKITLDGFSKMSEPDEGIPHILEVLCHPLNFQDPKVRKDFVKKLNAVLAYDKLEIFTTDKDAQVLGDDGFPISAPPAPTEAPKTSTDYVKEALNFFKDEYNKVRISGLTYEYPLGDNFAQSNFEPEPNAINYAYERRKAVERLKEVGFIGSYEIDERVIDDYGNVVDYAICKIDESKLTQKEAPSATAAGVNNVAETIVRHYHHFDNSIQEKGIDLNHKFESGKKDGLYITKDGDDFSYKGRFLKLSKTSDYYKVFSALYAKLPSGGEISYKDLITEVKSRLPEKEKVLYDEMKKFIQRNLTDKSNGFVRYADIPETEDNGRSLIYVNRGSGIVFNNQAG